MPAACLCRFSVIPHNGQFDANKSCRLGPFLLFASSLPWLIVLFSPLPDLEDWVWCFSTLVPTPHVPYSSLATMDTNKQPPGMEPEAWNLMIVKGERGSEGRTDQSPGLPNYHVRFEAIFPY